MLDFLFITSPTHRRSIHPPYYFLYLAGYLESRGWKCKIIDRADKVQAKDAILRNPARFVGFSCFTPDYAVVMDLAKYTRAVQPKTSILVGNAHAAACMEDFYYEGSPITFVVKGEGEKTLNDLAKGDGTAVSPEKLIKGSEIAQPAYHLIDMKPYRRPQRDLIRWIYTRSIAIFGSRGRPYNCKFCSANMVWQSGGEKKVRYRPVSSVIWEMWNLKENYGMDYIYFQDDMFGANKKWTEEFFVLKSTSKWTSSVESMPYAVQLRANHATEELIRGLKETGCVQVDIGVESGSQRLLDLMDKKITVEQVKEAFSLIKKYKMRTFASFMINLPTERYTDLAYSDILEMNIEPDGSVVSITTPYPGTQIHGDYKIKLDKKDYWKYLDARNDEVFRMSEHKLNFSWLKRSVDRGYRVRPVFRLLGPMKWWYWKRVDLRYLWEWLKIIPIDFLKYFFFYFRNRI